MYVQSPRPSIFELELPLSDICWKEKKIFSQYKTVVTVINIDSRFSRSRQLGGHMPAFRLGVPPRYKANKL